MRPIKFRRYSRRNKQYAPVGYPVYNLTAEEPIELLNDDVLEQYTGVNDYNNQEIYENDVVSTTPMVPGDPDYIIGVVKYYDGAYWIDDNPNNKAIRLFSETLKLEVVGNIHSFDIAKGRKSK